MNGLCKIFLGMGILLPLDSDRETKDLIDFGPVSNAFNFQ